MNFTWQEIADLRKAIEMAQEELCVDFTGKTFPEGTKFYERLELLNDKLIEHDIGAAS